MKTAIKTLLYATLIMSNSIATYAQDEATPAIRNKNIAENTNGEYTYERFSISGKKSIFGTYYSVNLNCTAADWTETTITQEAQHGKSKIVEQMIIIQYPNTNPRSSCNGKSIKGKVLEYTPDKDYKGADGILVELINSSGQLLKYEYKITVK